MSSDSLPKTMRALRYEKPEEYSVVEVPLPKLREGDVLIKVSACGVCGTGHEFVGKIAATGSAVKNWKIGQRVVADVSELCGDCFYCRRGKPLLCLNFESHGVTLSGGFASYVVVPAYKTFVISDHLDDISATLMEPASCAAHGLEKIAPKMGSSVLMMGAGPTGLLLSQFLRQNGGCHVVLAANAGLKMEVARKCDAADVYVDLDRKNPDAQWQKLKDENPYGFDIVIEATGSVKLLENAINYVRRGGKLVVYGVYSSSARVSWPPSKIFGDEIEIIGSFSETFQFPNALAYLDGKNPKVKTNGIVNKT